MTVEDATSKQHTLVGVVSFGEGCAKVFDVIIFFVEGVKMTPPPFKGLINIIL